MLPLIKVVNPIKIVKLHYRDRTSFRTNVRPYVFLNHGYTSLLTQDKHMNNAQQLNPQQQLRNPYCKRAMRFTKEGYEALMEVKRRLEAKLERPISESVAIDMVLLGGSFI